MFEVPTFIWISFLHTASSTFCLQHDFGIKKIASGLVISIFDCDWLLYLLVAQSTGPSTPQHSHWIKKKLKSIHNMFHSMIHRKPQKFQKSCLLSFGLHQRHLFGYWWRHIPLVWIFSTNRVSFYTIALCWGKHKLQLQFRPPRRSIRSRRTERKTKRERERAKLTIKC